MNSEAKQTAREQLGPSETSYAVTTRAQANNRKLKSKEKHNPPIGEQFPFDNSLFDTGRKHKSIKLEHIKELNRNIIKLRLSLIMNLLSYKQGP